MTTIARSFGAGLGRPRMAGRHLLCQRCGWHGYCRSTGRTCARCHSTDVRPYSAEWEAALRRRHRDMPGCLCWWEARIP